ncbi:MAG: hypothetical protein OXP71_08115 [Candidatus Poribacteria bacterium]|nr:hypothetical protein [Candidatus Poribacteria bacterium]
MSRKIFLKRFNLHIFSFRVTIPPQAYSPYDTKCRSSRGKILELISSISLYFQNGFKIPRQTGVKCAPNYGECRCRSIGFGSKIGKGYWKTGTKKARQEIDMQSFDCRKNRTLNAVALANKLAGLTELSGLKAAVRVLIFDYLMRVNDNQTLSAKLLGRSRYATCRRSFGCRESANEMRSGDCFFQP